jgi:hypothetical protein
MRKVVLFGVLAAAMATVSGASAARATGSGDSLGMAEKGSLIISADRLFGATWTQSSVDNPQKYKDKYTSFGLLWGSPVTSTAGLASPYNIPRAGVDYTIISNLTIGGSIGFFSQSHGTERTNPNNGVITSQDAPSVTAFALAPRVGYVLGFSPNIGLWLRGGLTYFTTSVDLHPDNTQFGTPSSYGFSGFSINLEPQLVLAPVEHFAFTVGLVADLPLGGSQKTTTYLGNGATQTESIGLGVTNIGLTVGLLGWF